ncbi:MAG: DegT/DnrJ/EryC1/StrS family aminotransferase [Nitrospirae bacterium]|nr:DegT/DnrJ/EryC1/StrS family aminotransferase [Nitrospirota bacterium]
MKIPFVDLKRQHEFIGSSMAEAVQAVIDRNAFVMGEENGLFEHEFAEFCGVRYCAGVSSGTDALHIALLSLGIGQGDEVITVSNSFIATALAITYSRAKPVFVDCSEKDFLIDYNLIENSITEKTKAIIVVHLYGQLCDMRVVCEIANRYGLKVIEDACQGHGAVDERGNKAGSFGDVSAFSFYPGKNLGAWGDAGALITNDEEIYNKICLYRNYGQRRKYHHDLKGFNKRLDTIQASVLRVKLRYLERFNNERRRAALIYNEILKGDERIILPTINYQLGHVFHLYVVRVKDRERVQKALSEKGISTGLHYPVPIHLTDAYRELNLCSLPITERLAGEILSLPMFPLMSEDELSYTAECLKGSV